MKESYSFDHEGVPVVMRVGDLLEDNDPRAVGREAFLEPAQKAAQRAAGTTAAVETTSAAPGERRATGTSGKAARRS
ncbi:hypothetical protein [Micromonospora aurantiaca (nom. illeg.)]|uniref:hypothetical protein n=1 Tax=Micromonospora aurantiaca (nom. illeg.) TaxID=47850 RepID=UPI0033FA93A7